MPRRSRTSRLIYATSPALDHARDGHPESNARVPAILDALLDANLTPEARPGELALLDGFAPASAEQVMSVHTKNYVRGLDMLARTRAPLDIDASPTYLTTASYAEALNGVGAALALVDAVVLAARAREELSGDALNSRPRASGCAARPATTRCLAARWAFVSSAPPPRRRATRRRDTGLAK